MPASKAAADEARIDVAGLELRVSHQPRKKPSVVDTANVIFGERGA
ncbi:MAG: hypothetical protein R2748_06990 [Bryobacterales bacterium]